MGNFSAYFVARAKWAGRGNGGICGWVSLVIGAVLAALVLCFPKWTHQHISDTMNVVLVSLVPFLAGASVFLVRWVYSPYAVFKVERDKVIALKELMKSRIEVTCGRKVEMSILTARGTTFFRARLDLIGIEAVRNIEAAITAIRKDGKKLPLDEAARLTLHPGIGALDELREGTPEFVDVLKVEPDGKLALTLIGIYPAVDTYCCNEAGHTYELDVSITGSTRTQMRTFVFVWTGDRDTADFHIL